MQFWALSISKFKIPINLCMHEKVVQVCSPTLLVDKITNENMEPSSELCNWEEKKKTTQTRHSLPRRTRHGTEWPAEVRPLVFRGCGFLLCFYFLLVTWAISDQET